MFNVNDLWKEIIQKEYNREYYVDEFVEKVLQENNILRDDLIIDTSAGTGFISLDLIKRGYKVLAIDGDADMIRIFNDEAEMIGVDTECHHMTWSEIIRQEPILKGKASLVINKGASLRYATSWRNPDFDVSQADTQIMLAMYNFYDLLSKDGILYIDNVKDEHSTVEFEMGKIRLEGQSFKLFWKRESKRKKSIWEPRLEGKNVEIKFYNASYNLNNKELEERIRKTGFKDVKQINLTEEKIYQPYIARKK